MRRQFQLNKLAFVELCGGSSVFPAALLIPILLMVAMPKAGLAQLPAMADTFTNANQPSVNNGGDSNLKLDGSPAKRIYLRFDVQRVPATNGLQIARATLWLFPNTVNTAGSFDIFRVTSPWTETSLTLNNAPSRGAASEYPIPVPISTANANAPVSVEITALVRAWVNGDLPNNGVVIEASAGSGISVLFDSKESSGTSHQPQLVVYLQNQGPIGPMGPSGPQGLTGSQGPQGTQGPIGPAGSVGPIGPAGPTGAAGVVGPIGPAGPTGAPGVVGPIGPVGPAGETGATGAVGPIGLVGAYPSHEPHYRSRCGPRIVEE